MIQKYLIAETDIGMFLLTKLLPKEISSRIRFIKGNGYSAAVSKARSVLASSSLPVFLVLDSGTVNRIRVEEKKEYVFEMLRQMASPDRFDIFVFVPEIEVILFENKEICKKIFGRDHNCQKIAPGQTLRELTGTDDINLIQKFLETRMTADVTACLRNNRTVQELIEKSELPPFTSVCDRNYAHA